MANTIDQELYQYFLQLSEAEKKTVLQMLKTFVQGKKQSPERISIEQYNQEIEEALAQVQKGEVYTHDEVVKMIKSR